MRRTLRKLTAKSRPWTPLGMEEVIWACSEARAARMRSRRPLRLRHRHATDRRCSPDSCSPSAICTKPQTINTDCTYEGLHALICYPDAILIDSVFKYMSATLIKFKVFLILCLFIMGPKWAGQTMHPPWTQVVAISISLMLRHGNT